MHIFFESIIPRESFATNATKSFDAMNFDRPLCSQEFIRYLCGFAMELHGIAVLDQIEGIRIAGLDVLDSRC